MTDIVERLRQMGDWIEPKVWQHDPTAWEAADEIERWRYLAEEWERQCDTADSRAKEWEARHDVLEAEIERLRYQVDWVLSERKRLEDELRTLKEKSDE